ncbi:hypothetical protein ACLOJK_022216 [Asimina triloba]
MEGGFLLESLLLLDIVGRLDGNLQLGAVVHHILEGSHEEASPFIHIAIPAETQSVVLYSGCRDNSVSIQGSGRAAAKRACGVGQEPHFNALEIEGMASFGQQSKLVVGFELAQAAGVVEGVLEANNGLVEKNREGVDLAVATARARGNHWVTPISGMVVIDDDASDAQRGMRLRKMMF